MRLVAITHQDGSELKDFLDTGYWSGEVYIDKSASTYDAAGVSMKSVGCCKWFCKTCTGLVCGASSLFAKAQKELKGNMKGSAAKSSCLLLVQPMSPTAVPLFHQPWAEEPPIGAIFGTIGADRSRQTELQERSVSYMKALRNRKKATQSDEKKHGE